MKPSGKEKFSVVYNSLASRDVIHLDKATARRIKHAIESKLTFLPYVHGKPLHGILRSFWKLRVGDYRVVYHIVLQKVYVEAIAHRRDIYEIIRRRLGV